MMMTGLAGSGAGGGAAPSEAAESAAGAAGRSCSLRYSAVILSSELDGTLAALMPSSLAVHSRDSKVDPVGACVGLRGQRVKNIVRELNNEKVDIIPWSADIKSYVAKALDPAKLKSFRVDENAHRVVVTTTPDQLPLAVGKRGQNARLASRLTGWQIDIEAEADVSGFDAKVDHAVHELATVPGISQQHARVLVNMGFHSLEDLLEAEAADLESVPDIGEAAGSLLEAARGEMVRREATGQAVDQAAVA